MWQLKIVSQLLSWSGWVTVGTLLSGLLQGLPEIQLSRMIWAHSTQLFEACKPIRLQNHHLWEDSFKNAFY